MTSYGEAPNLDGLVGFYGKSTLFAYLMGGYLGFIAYHPLLII